MNIKSKKSKKLWWLLLPAGIIFILFGIIQDGYYDVLIKAKTICLECIGIG